MRVDSEFRRSASVGWIFERYVASDGLGKIAVGLGQLDILSPTGKPRWNREAIDKLLSNEKYKSAALLQKNYTADILTKKQKKNNGEIRQFYVEDSHSAIILPVVFDMV